MSGIIGANKISTNYTVEILKKYTRLISVETHPCRQLGDSEIFLVFVKSIDKNRQEISTLFTTYCSFEQTNIQ